MMEKKKIINIFFHQKPHLLVGRLLHDAVTQPGVVLGGQHGRQGDVVELLYTWREGRVAGTHAAGYLLGFDDLVVHQCEPGGKYNVLVQHLFVLNIFA